MNQDDFARQQRVQSNDNTRAIVTNTMWHDAELALRVARHSFENWRVATYEDTSSSALMHAYHTHEALHEAARSITTLIDTFRAEASALIATPARSTDIPTGTG
jgi:hypothetical protein